MSNDEVSMTISDSLRRDITIQARNLLSLHRISGKNSISIDLAQQLLILMGEITAQSIFKSAQAAMSNMEDKSNDTGRTKNANR